MKFGRLIATLMFTIFILTAGNCQATMPRSEIFLGSLTVGSTVDEMKRIYGEPQKGYTWGYENAEYMAIYGNNVMVNSFNFRSKVMAIHITANNGWRTPAGISVGTNIQRVFDLYGQPDYIKANSTKTVCVYYPNDFVEFQGKMVPDYGLFIKYNNDSKKISEIYLGGGDSTGLGFVEVYPRLAEGIVENMLKTDTPIEDFIKRKAEHKKKYGF